MFELKFERQFLSSIEGIVRSKNKGKEDGSAWPAWRNGLWVLGKSRGWRMRPQQKQRGSLECHARHWPFLSTEVAVEGLEVNYHSHLYFRRDIDDALN